MEIPHNLKSGKAYRGANVFWLWLAQEANGYDSAAWLTYKQAAEMGGNVRKGEKGTPVFFWSKWEKEDKATGKKEAGMFAKAYTVFNVAQCEGIELPAPAERIPEGERMAAAEALIAATGAKIVHGGTRAFYQPSGDLIRLPVFEDFANADGYYCTAFHEIGHWTGAEHRLNRTFGKRFGDDAYAFEELVAELTAAFVCGSQGFASVERDDHAAYLANWIRVLRNDSGAFVTAASAAQKAADYILASAAPAQGEAEPEGETLAQALAA
jgi:antirestriction protein ArdC